MRTPTYWAASYWAAPYWRNAVPEAPPSSGDDSSTLLLLFRRSWRGLVSLTRGR